MTSNNRPLQRILGPNAAPVAGGEFSYTPNRGGGWLFRSLRFQLATDANVATRAVSVGVTNQSMEYTRMRAAANQLASLTVVYGGYEGSSLGSSGAAVVALDFPSNGLWVPRGHTLSSITAAIQVGDLYTGVAAQIIEFPDGPDSEMWPIYPYFATPPWYE